MIKKKIKKKKPLKTTNTPIITKVTIFSTQECHLCQLEIAYLKAKKVDFQIRNIDTDLVDLQEMLSKSGQLGVPFTVIERQNGVEEKILGFDKTKLDKVLN